MNLKANSSNDPGNVEEENYDRSNEMSSRTKIRRTRLRMLFEEFQNEIISLEEKLDKCTSENAKLKAVNEELRQQVDDSTVFSKITSDTIDGSKVDTDISTAGDISTILILSNKLQEMIHVNKNITRVNAALRKDVKSLSSEREIHLQDITKLREESKYSRSPNPYNRYSVATMKDKIDNYEREIHQWKNDMKRADDHIADLRKELENYKRTNNNINNINRVTGENNQINDFSCNDGALNRVNSSPVSQLESRRKRVVPIGNSSATEALQKLVSQVDSTPKEASTDEDIIHDVYSDNSTFKSQLLEIPNEAEQTISSPKESGLEPSDKVVGNGGDLFTDPVRFPACVKLLELTKARHVDESLVPRSSPSSEAGKHFNSVSSPDNRNMLFWNNGMAFTNGNHTSGSPVVHHRPASNAENRSNKGDMDDDITIVLPSSDHSLIQHTPDSENHSRDMLFQSPRIFEAGSRPRIDQDLSPCSESNLPVSMNNGVGMMAMQNHSDYSYYQSSSYQGSHYVPLKKVKVEDSEK